MSYVRSVLQPNEKILVIGRLHCKRCLKDIRFPVDPAVDCRACGKLGCNKDCNIWCKAFR
jgi:hypothetical protein